MLNVVHTFDGPDKDFLIAEIQSGLASVEGVSGFKYASINNQLDSDEIMVITKWDGQSSYEHWTQTVGENKAFKQATPQIFNVIKEKY